MWFHARLRWAVVADGGEGLRHWEERLLLSQRGLGSGVCPGAGDWTGAARRSRRRYAVRRDAVGDGCDARLSGCRSECVGG